MGIGRRAERAARADGPRENAKFLRCAQTLTLESAWPVAVLLSVPEQAIRLLVNVAY
jgi:hypothetical protein